MAGQTSQRMGHPPACLRVRLRSRPPANQRNVFMDNPSWVYCCGYRGNGVMEKDMKLTLKTMPGRLAVSRLAPGSELPAWAASGPFRSISWTPEELSIVCDESSVPPDVRSERGWRGLMVVGPLDFALTGILLTIAGPLAQAGISIFSVSTFDTDYVLVKEEHLTEARKALADRGHIVM